MGVPCLRMVASEDKKHHFSPILLVQNHLGPTQSEAAVDRALVLETILSKGFGVIHALPIGKRPLLIKKNILP